MATISVSNGTQLKTALSGAKPCDTILLGSGNYGSFAFNDLKYSGYVTVRSAEKAPHVPSGSSALIRTRCVTPAASPA